MRFRASLLAILLPIFCGCQHTHLRYNSVVQSQTLHAIYEQQVLDNLAMFACNPEAVPYFAFPKTGATNLTDEGSLAADTFNHFRSAIGGGYKRSSYEGWELEPIRDPDKLRLMRCAYQRAVGYSDPLCDKCDSREKAFFGEQDTTDVLICEGQCGWFCQSSRRPKLKGCCQQVGCYCGTYVWIPEEGQAQFSRLVMRILDYAVHDPAASQLKTVEYYVDQCGNPTQIGKAVGKISAVVPIESNNAEILQGANVSVKIKALDTNKKVVPIQDAGVSIPKVLPRIERERTGGGALQFQQYQRAYGRP